MYRERRWRYVYLMRPGSVSLLVLATLPAEVEALAEQVQTQVDNCQRIESRNVKVQLIADRSVNKSFDKRASFYFVLYTRYVF